MSGTNHDDQLISDHVNKQRKTPPPLNSLSLSLLKSQVRSILSFQCIPFDPAYVLETLIRLIPFDQAYVLETLALENLCID